MSMDGKKKTRRKIGTLTTFSSTATPPVHYTLLLLQSSAVMSSLPEASRNSAHRRRGRSPPLPPQTSVERNGHLLFGFGATESFPCGCRSCAHRAPGLAEEALGACGGHAAANLSNAYEK